MTFDNLSPELKERAEACKTTEEILTLAQEVGYELTDAELESVSGGDFWDWDLDSIDPECRDMVRVNHIS